MNLLRYLKRDRYNVIDLITAIAIIIFTPAGGLTAAAFAIGGNFAANVIAGVIIRRRDRAE